MVAGLLSRFPFPALYLADLDAIEGRDDNDGTLRRLRREFPGLELWVDRGLRTAAGWRDWQAGDLGTPVIGSESRPQDGLLARLGDPRALLSLDHRDDGLAGPARLLEDAATWPGRVIVMDLDRVGTGRGPDLDRVRSIAARAGQRQVFAAGGVRSGSDLRDLSARGATGALVASALHDRRIGRKEILAVRDAARIGPH